MNEFILEHYVWFKALHVVSVVSWMAGLLYLPRLFVYHADARVGSQLSETLKVMERRLLRVIMNPAMILAWAFGLCLFFAGDFTGQGWLHAKLFFVVLLTVFHHLLVKWRKVFLYDENKRSAGFYRKINEVPTILMIAIVILAVVKPF